jgi:HemY protein
VTGRLDAFEWRVPLTGITSPPVIEPEPIPAAAAPAEIAAKPLAEGAAPAAEAVTSEAPKAKPEIKAGLKPEPVIPLVHAPDDPGPDAVEEIEAPAESGGWRKIFG